MHTHDKKQELKTEGRTIPWARFYDALGWIVTFGGIRHTQKRMLDAIDLQHGEYVLDVGCGTGTLAISAKQKYGKDIEIQGIDASQQMINVAQAKASKAGVEVDFQTGLIEDLPFQENHFDKVLNTLVFHHLPQDLQRRGLKEIFRVLKPGGWLVIVDMQSSPGGFGQRLSDLFINLHGGHKHMADNVSKLQPLLDSAGFEDVNSESLDRQFAVINGRKPSIQDSTHHA